MKTTKNVDLSVNLGHSNMRTGTMLHSYLRENNVYDKYECLLALTQAEVLAIVNKAIGVKEPTSIIEVSDTSIEVTYRTEGSYLTCTITTNSVSSAVRLEMVADPIIIGEIKANLSKSRYVTPRVEGVYYISIDHMYVDSKGQVRTIEHHKDTDDFESIRDELYPRVHVPLLMEMYADSDENNLILTGAPGTGKTCFVKKCLREIALHKKQDISVLYVKDRELLAKDSFWAKISQHPPTVLVLDDLDDELLPRTEGRNPIVNNMLSFSDGLFDVPTKIIITTNQPNTAVDSALIRPGRCFDILALPNLTWEEGLVVWTSNLEQTTETYVEIFGSNKEVTVSQASLISEYQRIIKSGVAPYLIDSSISIRKRVEEGETANA